MLPTHAIACVSWRKYRDDVSASEASLVVQVKTPHPAQGIIPLWLRR